MPFGQIVIGPPGSGKSTYCDGMQQLLNATGRQTAIINLDPANDQLPYTPAVDISDLISVEDVMTAYELGPNGGLIYCMEFIEKNLDWLKERLEPLQKDHYFLFDFPGQVELFTHHGSVKKIAEQLTRWSYRLVCVNLVDSHYCSDPTKFVSVMLVSLSSMIQLELPHVNVLSKMDLIKQYGKLAFSLEYYLECSDLSYLLEALNTYTSDKFRKMNEALCELIEDYSLVAFVPLTVLEKESMAKVLKLMDTANGYVYGLLEADKTPHDSVNSLIETISSSPHFMDQMYGKEEEAFVASDSEA